MCLLLTLIVPGINFTLSRNDVDFGVEGMDRVKNKHNQAKPEGNLPAVGGDGGGGGTDSAGKRGGGPIESLNLGIRRISSRTNNDGGGKFRSETI